MLDASGAGWLRCVVRKCPMQVAGNKCGACGRDIVLSSEGKFCPGCGAYAHLACEPDPQCHVCGQAFQYQESPKRDPLGEAIVPRALRPTNSFGPVLFLIAGLALLAIILYWLWEYGLTHMHDSM
jgi:hypothetical protein